METHKHHSNEWTNLKVPPATFSSPENSGENVGRVVFIFVVCPMKISHDLGEVWGAYGH